MGAQASSYHDAHDAQNVDLNEITSSDNNANILRRLRDNDPKLTRLLIIQPDDDVFGEDYAFVLGDGDDLGWLGYFIGRNKVLRNLDIYGLPEDREQITALFRGIEQSKSIQKLSIEGDELGESVLNSLSALLRSESCSLTSLNLFRISVSDDVAVALANALKGNKSLTYVSLSVRNPELREQIPILIRGIEQSKSIQKLSIEGDELGESVLNSLSALLRSESCSLTSFQYFVFSDDVAVALADALKGNKSLKHLLFSPRNLTSVGWSAFSKLLCDTSSVSNIYASNHSLREIGNSFDMTRSNYPQDVKQLLALNELTDKHAAIQKILKYHPDFDIGPFLGKKLKLLPLVMSWFERVRGIWPESKEEIQKRQLSTMYKFVRSMPLEAIGYRSYSSHKKRKFDFLGRNFHTLVLLCLLTLVLPLL